MRVLLNIAAYQVAWFACVLGAARQMSWLGTAVALAVAGIHVARAVDRRTQLQLIGIAALVGFVVDSTLAATGLVQFHAHEWLQYLAPLWMLGLWMAFATTFTTSLRWAFDKPLLPAALGALGGPLAYWSGAELGALNLPTLWPAVLVIGLLWAVAMTVLGRFIVRAAAPVPADGKHLVHAA